MSVSCSRSRLVQGSSWDFSLGRLPPWLLNPPSTHTASRQKAVPEPLLTPSETESHHTWSSSGNSLHIPRGLGFSIVWLLKHLCHGCIMLSVLRRYVPWGWGMWPPPSCTPPHGTRPYSVPLDFRVLHSANSQRAFCPSLYPRTTGQQSILCSPQEVPAGSLSLQTNASPFLNPPRYSFIY